MKRETLPIPVVVPDTRVHAARRTRLAKTLREGLVLLATAPEATRNADSHYEFRWDSHFYYLTGFREPEAVLAIQLGNKPRHILFCRDKNVEREIWDGFRFGPAIAREVFRFDEAWPIGELDARIPDLMANVDVVHTPLGASAEWDQSVTRWLNGVRAKARTGVSAPTEVRDLRKPVAAMRLIKDKAELDIMARAARISADAHARAMRFARPGMHEYQVEAELLHEFVRNGARQPAYGSIVAAGANACVLHYRENTAQLKQGELLLIDAGCELDSYAADITRTFPVGGRFSGPQRDIYELVLEAQLACIKAVKPGMPFGRYHEVANEVLAQGLIDLKLCRGSLATVLEKETYKQFYMHRAGHWLGLDVHDAGEYKRDGKWVKLQPGMVLTVEPGLYIRPADNVPRKFWDIGVRIEDDILVTDKGNLNLTAACPKSVRDVEALTAA
ncbi:MAG TPA: aminopeptidase P N-terminal domain-containing protein [Usitatibacteraceae bacterium]|nr:aminopeptidase P N-terminal domain-containing protein [Usitatibacteraceae bacterium]